jgi:hypothetical protein
VEEKKSLIAHAPVFGSSAITRGKRARRALPPTRRRTGDFMESGSVMEDANDAIALVGVPL